MKYLTIKKCDILNGPGVRVSLWVSGCNHHCKNCHNPETHDKNAGKPFGTSTVNEICRILEDKYIDGITLTGGDPMFPDNRQAILELCKTIRDKFGYTKDIMIYSGYTYEELMEDSLAQEILGCTDILVDGKFKQELANCKLRWRGSSNQRLIDLNRTRKSDTVITLEEN